MEIIKIGSISLLLLLSACSEVKKSEPEAQIKTPNPLLAKWTGPFGGVPAFDKMKLADIKPAFEQAMKENLVDIDAIANNPTSATFENTIEALQRAGKSLDRGFVYYGIWSGNLSSKEFRVIQRELVPKFSEMSSKIQQNKKLFERTKKVYEDSLKHPLEQDQQRVIKLVYEGFAMGGAELGEEAKIKYAAINKELSGNYTQFSNNLLHDEENYPTFFSKDQLNGLSESYIKSAAAAAKAQSKPDMYAVTNTRSSMNPFLTYSDERDLREKVWNNYYSRGDNGGEFDNNKLITKVLQLRQQRVKLLGFDNYAQWRLQNRMAKTPENALGLLRSVWPPAIARVAEEVADMQVIADSDNITIEPWDYRYYAEKVRKKKYDLDSNEVKQYLELGNLTDALHFVAGELFNFKFCIVAQRHCPCLSS